MPRSTRQEFQMLMDRCDMHLDHIIADYSKMLTMMSDLAQQATKGEFEWNESYERQGEEYATLLEMALNWKEAHGFVRRDF